MLRFCIYDSHVCLDRKWCRLWNGGLLTGKYPFFSHLAEIWTLLSKTRRARSSISLIWWPILFVRWQARSLKHRSVRVYGAPGCWIARIVHGISWNYTTNRPIHQCCRAERIKRSGSGCRRRYRHILDRFRTSFVGQLVGSFTNLFCSYMDFVFFIGNHMQRDGTLLVQRTLPVELSADVRLAKHPLPTDSMSHSNGDWKRGCTGVVARKNQSTRYLLYGKYKITK